MDKQKGKQQQRILQQANKKLLIRFACFAVIMFGFGFAMVPLYDVFCDITGLNGKTNQQAVAAGNFNPGDVDKNRNISIQFTVTNNEQMPWEFEPNVAAVTLHPGEIKRVSYYAKNLTDKDMTAQAIPSVSPAEAASYLKKIVCFCFNSPSLAAHAEANMEVQFYVDKSIPEHLKTLTLSYTLFDITNQS